MEELVAGERNVYLRKINISDWQSAVTDQYKVTSIPNFRVFAPDRQQFGKSTASVDAVARLIDQAQ